MKDSSLTYWGSVKDGNISLPKRLRQEVTKVFDGHSIEVTFKRKRKRRSIEQNRYYWGVVIPCIIEAMIDMGNDALQIGNSEHAELVHEFLKAKILDNGEEVILADGVVEKLPASTRKTTTTEFAEYTDKVIRWAAEMLNIAIPEPNEQSEIFS
jgi:hypothetical protein